MYPAHNPEDWPDKYRLLYKRQIEIALSDGIGPDDADAIAHDWTRSLMIQIRKMVEQAERKKKK